MNFLKFSLLLVFISLVAGLTPSFLKLAFSDIQPSKAIAFKKTAAKAGGIKYVYAEKAKIPVYLADTEEKRTKGLGGLASIPRDYGMLFVFDSPDYLNIWMKDMLFSIDIIWMDENFKIVRIEKNISPNTYPKIFTAPVKARFVLELNARMSEFYNLKTGETIIFGSK